MLLAYLAVPLDKVVFWTKPILYGVFVVTVNFFGHPGAERPFSMVIVTMSVLWVPEGAGLYSTTGKTSESGYCKGCGCEKYIGGVTVTSSKTENLKLSCLDK